MNYMPQCCSASSAVNALNQCCAAIDKLAMMSPWNHGHSPGL